MIMSWRIYSLVYAFNYVLINFELFAVDIYAKAVCESRLEELDLSVGANKTFKRPKSKGK